jgi:hypothetical protein
MKLFLSISLIVIMIASITVPLLIQWQDEDVCELKECKSDEDSDDEFKVGKEKEVYLSNGHSFILSALYSSEKNKEKQYFKHDCLISNYHASQLEMPPDA